MSANEPKRLWCVHFESEVMVMASNVGEAMSLGRDGLRDTPLDGDPIEVTNKWQLGDWYDCQPYGCDRDDRRTVQQIFDDEEAERKRLAEIAAFDARQVPLPLFSAAATTGPSSEESP